MKNKEWTDETRSTAGGQVAEVRRALNARANPNNINTLQRFFKTGKGEYGEGDVLIGVKVPQIRHVVKEFKSIPLALALELLQSKIHEERLLALLFMVRMFDKGDTSQQKLIYAMYLQNTRHINNWDLVDTSAPHIVGKYLFERERKPLWKLAQSKNLWERRIAIISTQFFIRQNDFGDTLKIARILLADDHDLIQKAVGWMLREIGDRDRATEENFLSKHYRGMPRIMLRYAIEKLPEKRRKEYLLGTV